MFLPMGEQHPPSWAPANTPMPNEPNWSSLFAHTSNRRGEADPLLRHLERVATKAAGFAEQFGGEDAARLAGILHDIGKVRPQFQKYLRRLDAGEKIARGPQHAIWGGVLAYKLLRERGWEQVALPVLATTQAYTRSRTPP